MCHFIYLASPLTLSEVRAMLPPGLAADLLDPGEHRALRALQPEAQTAVRIVRGGCSCDFLVERRPDRREDEAHLRARYRALGATRDLVLRALDRHRRGGEGPLRPPEHWGAALAGFLVEHARNAGRSLVLRQFSPGGRLHPTEAAARALRAGSIDSRPGAWLPENVPTVLEE